ncbi:hypothetical protein IMCC12053_944 [Celeribacter marinus]|uniref:Uncharacterized protein n=1 Tax=Celeribacter marinus TaxID=1397108 RepID=A0A0N9ZGI7_9RHOB|nr:hypothetical protein IMCC12053_944 [Celeribacter marinus]
MHLPPALFCILNARVSMILLQKTIEGRCLFVLRSVVVQLLNMVGR